MLNTKKYHLRSMPKANCHVEIEKDSYTGYTAVRLISYKTRVIEFTVIPALWKVSLLASGTYSATTARHINRFTKEFFGTNLYHDIAAVVGHYELSYRQPDYGLRYIGEYEPYINVIENYLHNVKPLSD